MSYGYVYQNGAGSTGGVPTAGYGVNSALMSAGYPNGVTANMYNARRQRSYSPRSFSSESDSADEYEYRGRMITRETRCPRDVVRAPTPPPIIKRVVERAPTPEAPVMERVIIRPQPQEIVERVIEQPRTPPPRIIQKEMHEEAPPPIVRTRVIKVDRPLRIGYSQPGSPYGNPNSGLPSFSNGAMGCGNAFRTQSIVGSVGRPVAYHNALDQNPSFSSGSSFEYTPPTPMVTPGQPTAMMMMQPSQQAQSFGVMSQQPVQSLGVMPQTQVHHLGVMTPSQTQPLGVMSQQPVQSLGVMQQSQAQPFSYMPQQQVQPMSVMQQPVQQQQMMYRPVQMQSSMQQMTPQSIPQLPSSYLPQTYMYPAHQGMSFGYHPMMQQGGMVPSGMPLMGATNPLLKPASTFPGQSSIFNPMAQQLVF